MPEPSKMSAEARAYFDSLPKQVQEQLMQSGACVQTKEDLQKIYKNLLEKEPLE